MTEKTAYELQVTENEEVTVKRFLGIKTKTLKKVAIGAGVVVGAGVLYKVVTDVIGTDIEDVVEELVD